ncbi:hypothetical protein [Gluconobacter roseus]|nr:hypothetical protein [Gluconobacter roseus]KXV43053.1 hypothetical protein AD943_08670 [Gluconobacter roseus]
MSRRRTSFVLGYHGCDAEVGEKILRGAPVRHSEEDYDWLGHGAYFWESDPGRAWMWADSKVSRGSCTEAFVVGAIIDLGNCLDLTEQECIQELSEAYAGLKATFSRSGSELPANKDPQKFPSGDKLQRYLDCAVINYLCEAMEEMGEMVDPYDTVRGLFVEGSPAYPGAGFYALTHTQIAVRRPECIIGTFRVHREREADELSVASLREKTEVEA